MAAHASSRQPLPAAAAQFSVRASRGRGGRKPAHLAPRPRVRPSSRCCVLHALRNPCSRADARPAPPQRPRGAIRRLRTQAGTASGAPRPRRAHAARHSVCDASAAASSDGCACAGWAARSAVQRRRARLVPGLRGRHAPDRAVARRNPAAAQLGGFCGCRVRRAARARARRRLALRRAAALRLLRRRHGALRRRGACAVRQSASPAIHFTPWRLHAMAPRARWGARATHTRAVVPATLPGRHP